MARDNKPAILVPIFKANIGKESAEGVIGVKISDPIDGSKTATINIVDPYLKVIGNDIYTKDTPISVSIELKEAGYTESFKGYISAIDIDFPQDGIPTVAITAIDCSHLLNDKRKSRTWSNISRAEVIRLIAREHGLSYRGIDVPDTKQKSLVQDDVTDLEFIESLKKDEGDEYILKFGDNEVIYSALKNGKVTATLNYKCEDFSLLSFSPKINKETKETQVQDKDIKPETKKESSATDRTDNMERNDTPSGNSSSQVRVSFDYGGQSFVTSGGDK